MRGKSKKDLSTILIIDQKHGQTKSLRVKTRHVQRLKHYIVYTVLFLLVLIGVSGFYSYKASVQDRELHVLLQQIASLRKQIPDSSDTLKTHNYLKSIDSKLRNINQYLQKRGVQGFSIDAVGGESSNTERFSTEEELSYYDDYLDKVFSGISHTPVGYPAAHVVTSVFGYRSNPFGRSGAEFHSGLDFKGRKGDPVKSTASGQIVFAGWSQGYGKCVRVRHLNNYETLYGHLSSISVKKGQRVTPNQVIGKIGSTGRSTGYHLHYEVRLNNKLVNPKKFLQLN